MGFATILPILAAYRPPHRPGRGPIGAVLPSFYRRQAKFNHRYLGEETIQMARALPSAVGTRCRKGLVKRRKNQPNILRGVYVFKIGDGTLQPNDQNSQADNATVCSRA